MIRLSKGVCNKDVEGFIMTIHTGKKTKATKSNIPKWFLASGETDLEKLYYQKTITKGNMLILNKKEWEETKGLLKKEFDELKSKTDSELERFVTEENWLDLFFCIKLRYYKIKVTEVEIADEDETKELVLKWEILSEQYTYELGDQELKNFCNEASGCKKVSSYYLPINELFQFDFLEKKLEEYSKKKESELNDVAKIMLILFENKETVLIQAYKTFSLEIIRTAERTIYREHVDRAIDYVKIKDQEYFKYNSGFKEYFFDIEIEEMSEKQLFDFYKKTELFYHLKSLQGKERYIKNSFFGIIEQCKRKRSQLAFELLDDLKRKPVFDHARKLTESLILTITKDLEEALQNE